MKLEHTIIAVVMVMDSRGKPFNVDQLDHMMLLPHPYSSHITIRLVKGSCYSNCSVGLITDVSYHTLIMI